MNKNKKIAAGVVGTIVLLMIIFYGGGENDEVTRTFTTPDEGEFLVTITSTGELRATNSRQVMGPENADDVGIYRFTIQDMVTEGTEVQAGDYVAELDRTELHTNLQEEELELQAVLAQYEQAQLDSSLSLTQARYNIENLNYQLEEDSIAVTQSIYESPAVQRQAEIAMERTRRELEQEKLRYLTQEKQAEATLREIETELYEVQTEVDMIRDLDSQFTVYAQEAGMVVYRRDRRGTRTAIGSEVNAREPIIAELPDFGSMESVSYVNEVDIQNVQAGQPVTVKLDAIREKVLSGTVTYVANIGEQRNNSDSKVFEVIIKINEEDTDLRPTMTSSNEILVDQVENATYLPIETIHYVDASNFVFKQRGSSLVLQQVILGPMNDTGVVIRAGVSMDDQILVSMPTDTLGIERVYLPDDVVNQLQDEIADL